MNYILQANFGQNVYWKARFGEIKSDKPKLYGNYPLSFQLNLLSGLSHGIDKVPDLVIVDTARSMRGVTQEDDNYLLGTDQMIDALMQFESIPYERYTVGFHALEPAIDLEKYLSQTYSLLVFRDSLNDLTHYPETAIEIIELSDMSNRQIVKGYCKDLADFHAKQQQFTREEGKMIKFKTYAMTGNIQIFGHGRDFVSIGSEVKEALALHHFYGVNILENRDYDVRNIK